MEENDRLIGKIEKLVDIFGSNLDTEISKYTSTIERTPVRKPSNQPVPETAVVPKDRPKSPPSVLLTNTRLFLLSRRAKRDQTSSEGAPTHAFSPRDDGSNAQPAMADLGRKLKIDRSMGALVEMSPEPARPAEKLTKKGLLGGGKSAAVGGKSPKVVKKTNDKLKEELSQLDEALKNESNRKK
jgi:hypothetical protein